MRSTDQTDAFDGIFDDPKHGIFDDPKHGIFDDPKRGIFDDPKRGIRERIQAGKVVATAERRAIPSNALAKALGTHKPFGKYPPPPSTRTP